MGINVIDPNENTRVPFLRGILTRSLRDAGLPFTEAYDIANQVRSQLGPDAEVSTDEVKQLVIQLLEKAGYDATLTQYTREPQHQPPILVTDRNGHQQPFSKDRLSQSLEICAFPQGECYAITSDLERQLLSTGIHEISSTELAERTYEYLQQHKPPEMAHRYLVWVEFERSGHPLILLIGGTTGSGKSTISSETAHRLNIAGSQSTDMLREVMRLMIPQRLLPELHVSSFSAWKTLPSRDEDAISFERHFIDGYLTQAREVAVGIEGVFQRAVTERISIIVEGVHIFPTLQEHMVQQSGDAIVVPLIMAVLKRKQLRKQLQRRGQQIATRGADRYLEDFEAIWELQTFLLGEADRHEIPIIPNVDLQETIRLVMETISEQLALEYSGKPGKVFA